MKPFFFFLILLVSGFIAGFGAARWKVFESIALCHSPKKSHWSEFRATPYPLDNLPFCVFIYGKNNGAYLEKTLQSVFLQKYENFRIIYIDDASDDGSQELARDVIKENSQFARVHLVRNTHPLGFLASLSESVENCMDEEIIVVLNGEDYLAHEWVLARLNQYYADPDLWLTYGNSLEYPTYQPSSSPCFHTFYAALFKEIRKTGLQGDDLSYKMAMLEIAKDRCQHLPDILLICNQEKK
ncbi:MAG TPA: glycosyltransferase family A protein [Chlamydiales bacterium]|nr:glycosyltransferase family A protein [Chlamydiales bacterium]